GHVDARILLEPSSLAFQRMLRIIRQGGAIVIEEDAVADILGEVFLAAFDDVGVAAALAGFTGGGRWRGFARGEQENSRYDGQRFDKQVHTITPTLLIY